MPRRGLVYIWTVFVSAIALTGAALPADGVWQGSWQPFAILCVLATLAQLFKVDAPKQQAYFATPIFLFAAVLLLDPVQFVLIVVISHLMEWAKERWIGSPRLRSWYGQPFNIAKHVVAGLSAAWISVAVAQAFEGYGAAAQVLAVSTAAVAYVILNQAILGLVLSFVEGTSFRESGALDRDNLVTELVMACLGYVVAFHWHLEPWMILPGLSPLILIYRALTLHRLKNEAQTDPKTGLWNARHFAKLFASELERAQRFNRPMAVLMADLDLLRNINNTYGHLAGDTVLAGIGHLIKKTVREYDIAGRFGGEEFAIVLPEVTLDEARAMAERLRQAIESASFEVNTSPTPIHCTMSIGIACYPEDGFSGNDLIHSADIAVYQAKIQGRNRVIVSTDVPHSVRLEHESKGSRLDSPYPFAFSPRPASLRGGAVSPVPAGEYPAGEHAIASGPASDQVALPPVVMGSPASVQLSLAVPQSVTMPPTSAPLASVQPELSRAIARGQRLLPFYVGAVTIAGVLATIAGVSLSAPPTLLFLGLFVIMITVAEVLQISVYEDNTMSVGMAIFVAAALLTGLPGVAVVSVAAALTDHLQRRRPMRAIHKTAFNWANHVLACVAPVVAVRLLDLPIDLAHLPRLVPTIAVASMGFYLVESTLISVAIGLSQGKSPLLTWRGQFQWLAGHYLALGILGLFMAVSMTLLGPLGILVFVLPVGMLRYAQKMYVERTRTGVLELKRMNQELGQANREVIEANGAIQQLNQELQYLNSELFLTLGKILDTRDPFVASHAGQVATYATEIAAELGLPAQQVEQVRQAGYLHDIGKIGIPERILFKPSKLTDEEFELMKTHAPLGGVLLQGIHALSHLAPFVRHHHERWDGRGYPDGLQGEQIPLEARILNLCDSVEAMASDRPYKRAMSLDEILDEVKRCRATQFDPDVVDAFLRVSERKGSLAVVNSALVVERSLVDRTITPNPSPVVSFSPSEATVAT